MKISILLIGVLTAITGFAKVGDFNSLIVENSKAQTELHQNLKLDLETTHVAYQKESQEKFIVDRESNSINVPTTKSMLTFRKETKYYRASETQQQKRLAQELSEAQ